jgi:4'-phosphopantetheinyl transferase
VSSADPWRVVDPRQAPPLAPGRVVVWRIPLPWSACEEWDVTLPACDVERLAGLTHPSVRARHLHTRVLLRTLRARYTGINPVEQREVTGAHGKPGCVSGRVCFNLSHTDDAALLAFASDGEVGVDIETTARTRRIEPLAERYFHPQERAFLRDQGNDPATFLRIWTAKEALLKAAGLGITVELAEMDVTPALGGGEWQGFGLTPVPVELPRVGHLAVSAGQIDWYSPLV